MTIKEMMTKLIKDNNSSYARLAAGLGLKSTGPLAHIGKSNNVNIQTLLKICEYYDYDIVIRPRASANRAERTIVLGNEVQVDD